MSALRPLLPFLLSIFAMAVLSWPQAEAQLAPRETARPFTAITAEWNRKLAAIEQYVTGLNRDPARSDEFRALADQVRASALTERARAQRTLETLQKLLNALGPPPAQDAPPENPDIAAQRAQYQQDITDYKARVAQADLAQTRANELEDQISALFVERLIAKLSVRFPSPLLPETVSAALPEAGHVLAAILSTPTTWWHNLPERERRPGVIFRSLAFLIIAIFGGWAIRHALLTRFGPDPGIDEPTFARRLVGAVAEGLARGIIPAAIVGMLLFRTLAEGSILEGPFADVVSLFCQSLILFIIATALPKATLSPRIPSWRLSALSAENARSMARIIAFVAAVFSLDLFFYRVVNVIPDGIKISAELMSVYALAFNFAEGIGLLAALQGRLWNSPSHPATPQEEDEDESGEEGRAPENGAQSNRFWGVMRLLGALLIVGAISATLFGYANLGTYVINNMLGTGVAWGLLYLLRGLLRDLIGIGLRVRFVTRHVLVTPTTRRLVKFWLRWTLDLVLWIGAVLIAAPIWSVPVVPMLQWFGQALTQLKIGNFTISIADIGLSLVVFFVVLALMRWMQRGLSDRILPETRLDPGVRHSVAAGFGYLGFAIAAVIAISIVGIDLSNLALIAGALSVGIGFGLQNVVNNFVSGLILLIERPIKVGDWVVVGDKEGTVKQIRVRATEIETFQRASVIIPNSELLSTAVVNWTHSDRMGRVEIVIGVAYGSDTERVREILLDVARENPQVSRWPPPYVRFKDFGDSALVFELRCYLYDIGHIITVSSDLRFAVDKAFREAGIQIPFPQRDLHIPDLERLVEKWESGPEPGPQAPEAPAAGPKKTG